MTPYFGKLSLLLAIRQSPLGFTVQAQHTTIMITKLGKLKHFLVLPLIPEIKVEGVLLPDSDAPPVPSEGFGKLISFISAGEDGFDPTSSGKERFDLNTLLGVDSSKINSK